MGANVACYVTCGISEAESVKLTSFIEKLSLIGASKGMLSNRVSFALNLTGKSSFTAYYKRTKLRVLPVMTAVWIVLILVLPP